MSARFVYEDLDSGLEVTIEPRSDGKCDFHGTLRPEDMGANRKRTTTEGHETMPTKRTSAAGMRALLRFRDGFEKERQRGLNAIAVVAVVAFLAWLIMSIG